ncbi:MAG: hypothetical protein AAFY38_11430 [Pseudomonadota bacterium]
MLAPRLTSLPLAGDVPGASCRIEAVRGAAVACRALARVELLPLCAALQAAPALRSEPYAEALVRVLPEALGTFPRFYAPGAAERSFDEAWLAALFGAHRRGDASSLAFLLMRRVAPAYQRSLRFLIGRVADLY